VPWGWIILGLALPTLITWVYFDLLSNADSIYQKTSYAIGKGSQFLLLSVVVAVWLRKELFNDLLKSCSSLYLRIGFISGTLIGFIIVGAYFAVLIPLGLLDTVSAQAKEKLSELGADSPAVLLLISGFYALIHSGLEEIYWRSFVFRELAKRIPPALAVLVSSIGFMAHHVIVLAKYFGYQSPMTYICSLGVAMGGVWWAWLALRSNSLLPGWISHAIVDAAIFGVGYLLVFG
jgi:membrane protease YdiL (CAAX protease family)